MNSEKDLNTASDWHGHLYRYRGQFLVSFALSMLLMNFIAFGAYAARWNVLFYAFAFLCFVGIANKINEVMANKHGAVIVHGYVSVFLTGLIILSFVMFGSSDSPLLNTFIWSIPASGFAIWVFTCVSHKRVSVK
ncbi:hypothetical protein IPM19_00230 [bacterium]|nr:MAG: hypothetical protein IPM19_00230 [bacterium]